MAKDVFAQARAGYHPITTASVAAAIAKPPAASQGATP